ncbi:MAG: hypothetical protein ABSE71_00705 [Candidatus Micrarchaeaceae archaeon]|jgi:hypothetical protein|nr:hypothetical protein [Candidatus Micrarchaeota archaeon]HII09560.1 hypothetical protein [Candidatus Micrarchaeota archaeon]
MEAQKQQSAARTPKILTKREDIRRILDRCNAHVINGPLRVLVHGTSAEVDVELKSLSHVPEHLKAAVVRTALYAIEQNIKNFETGKALRIAQGLELPKEQVKLAVLAGVVGGYEATINTDDVVLAFNTDYLGVEGITEVDLRTFLERMKPAGLEALERRG